MADSCRGKGEGQGRTSRLSLMGAKHRGGMERRIIRVASGLALIIVLLFMAGRASAQSSTASARVMGTVTVRVPAPIYLYPDERRQPLVVAKEGSVIRVVGEDGDWYNVEFRDPALG